MPLPLPDEYCFLWINWWATCMAKAEWASWVQAVFSVGAIAGAFYIARWQAKRDRRERIEREIAAAEIAGGALVDVVNRINWALLDLKFAVELRAERGAFKAGEHATALAGLVYPSETQLLALAPVINAGALGLVRAINQVKHLQRALAHMESLDSPVEQAMGEPMIEGLNPGIKFALEQMGVMQTALIELLGHKVAPLGRHSIIRE